MSRDVGDKQGRKPSASSMGAHPEPTMRKGCANRGAGNQRALFRLAHMPIARPG